MGEKENVTRDQRVRELVCQIVERHFGVDIRMDQFGACNLLHFSPGIYEGIKIAAESIVDSEDEANRAEEFRS